MDSSSPIAWQDLLHRRLPLYGHRNWIVVADAAYPWQTAPGIETVVAGGEQLAVLETVLRAVGEAPHVRPIVHLDSELALLPEDDAPGIDRFRAGLDKALTGHVVQRSPHEEIIGRLDAAGRAFHVLLLKTAMELPYTSIFLELDCGYWSGAKEKRLRAEVVARELGA